MNWKNTKVLVTGGAGFVGSHLVEQLIELEATVTVLDNFSRGSTKIVGANYKYGDAGIEGVCRDIFKNKEIIFNLAAEVAGVEFNQKNHALMYERNMRLLAIPLRIAEEYKVRRFLQTSSVCVYAPGFNNPCNEENGRRTEPISANAGYSWAKRMGERLAEWTDLHTVIVRPSNIYGPRDYFDERAHVIPALIQKCYQDGPIVVNGDPDVQREFIYVGDVAAGMIKAAENGVYNGIYNIGTNGETLVSIGDLIEMIRGATGMQHKEIIFKKLFDGGDACRYSSCALAYTQLDWKAAISMNEGLKKTIGWYELQDFTDN